jgi:large subunit ribosomal protein L25
MAEVETVLASPRDGVGKGSARQTRRDGQVPAVIYGNKEEPILLTLERRLLSRELENPQFFIQLVDIEIGGTKHRVLPRDVQFHPVSDVPMHVDFLRFDPRRKITAAVPVVFDGEDECPGMKRGGMLNIVRHEVEVLCTADDIPQELLLHLAGLDIGDSIHASAVPLPDGVTFVISDRDFTIATVAAPTVMVEETVEGEEGEEGEEGKSEESGNDDGDNDAGDGGEDNKG